MTKTSVASADELLQCPMDMGALPITFWTTEIVGKVNEFQYFVSSHQQTLKESITGGLFSKKSWTCINEGMKRPSLAAKPSSKGVEPPTVLLSHNNRYKHFNWPRLHLLRISAMMHNKPQKL